MKKYMIIIGRDEELCEKTQKVLFKLGYSWPTNTKVINVFATILYLEDDGTIRWDASASEVQRYTKPKAIWALDLIEKADIQDAIRMPGSEDRQITIDGKQFSESTIKNALRQYVD